MLRRLAILTSAACALAACDPGEEEPAPDATIADASHPSDGGAGGGADGGTPTKPLCVENAAGAVCPAGTSTAGALVEGLSDREVIGAPGLELRTARAIADQARGKLACQYSLVLERVVCATDLLVGNWTEVGTRLMVIDPATLEIEQRRIGTQLHSSYLFGDFNKDGWLDIAGFSDAEEPATNFFILYLGTADPWTFDPTEPLPLSDPAKAGAVLDFDGDRCEDLLVLGTAREDWDRNTFEYYPDRLLRGDCAGGFTSATAEAGLSLLPGMEGSSTRSAAYGRFAVVTELGGDRCSDLVIGNYRAQPNLFVESDCAAGYHRWAHDPDDDPSRWYFGHTVALYPFDLELRGELDLFVFNLWHPDMRGDGLDRSYLLRTRGSSQAPDREMLGYWLEAPFGSLVADLDGDRRAEVLMSTGSRWGDYQGLAAVLRVDQVVWRDRTGWLRMRETPVAVDLDLDGFLDLVADGRLLANTGARSGSQRWVGFVFEGRPVSGALVVLVDSDGTRAAFSLASDGRGQPSNMLTIGLGESAVPVALELSFPAGEPRRVSFDLTAMRDPPVGRYLRVSLR